MTLKLPPNYISFPPLAVFRKYPLPPDLRETWDILRGLAWVNNYAFTPPASVTELLQFHHNLKARALLYRLERLEQTGWLRVERQIGKRNIYVPIVPADEPKDYTMESTVRSGEPASLRTNGSEDLARYEIDRSEAISAEQSTHAMDCTSSIVVAVPVKLPDSSNVQDTTTTNSGRTRAIRCTGQEGTAITGSERVFDQSELDRITDAFIELGIWENAWDELLALPQMSVDYAENWVEHKRREGTKLTGAFYRAEMRAGRVSPYVAKANDDRPLRKEDFHPAVWERLSPANREAILAGQLHELGGLR